MNGRNASRGSFDCNTSSAATLPSTTTAGAVLTYDPIAGSYIAAIPAVDNDGFILTYNDGTIVFFDA